MQEQKRSILLYLAVFGLGMSGGFHFVTASALGGMATDPMFTGLTDTMIQQVATLPSLFVIPGSLLFGWLCTVISKKKLGLIALALMFFGGTAPMFLTNFPIILVARCIGGFCMGITIPLYTSIIADTTKDEPQARKKFYGLSSAMNAVLGGVCLSLIAGQLANYGWRTVFYIYIYLILVFILLLIGYKDPGKLVAAEGEKISFFGLPKMVYFYCFVTLLTCLCLNSVMLNTSMLIMSKNLGDPAMTGTAMSAMTGGSFLIGLCFAPMGKIFKKFHRPFGFLIGTIAFVILGSASSISMVILATFIVGLGFGQVLPANNVSVSNAAPVILSASVMAMANIWYNAGQYLTPLVVNNIANVVGDGSPSTRFYVVAGISFIITIWLFIRSLLNKKPPELPGTAV